MEDASRFGGNGSASTGEWNWHLSRRIDTGRPMTGGQTGQHLVQGSKKQKKTGKIEEDAD